MYVCAYRGTYVCMCVHIRTLCMCVRIEVRMCAYRGTYVCMCVHIEVHMYVCVCI